jgi:hypothetical protein
MGERPEARAVGEDPCRLNGGGGSRLRYRTRGEARDLAPGRLAMARPPPVRSALAGLRSSARQTRAGSRRARSVARWMDGWIQPNAGLALGGSGRRACPLRMGMNPRGQRIRKGPFTAPLLLSTLTTRSSSSNIPSHHVASREAMSSQVVPTSAPASTPAAAGASSAAAAAPPPPPAPAQASASGSSSNGGHRYQIPEGSPYASAFHELDGRPSTRQYPLPSPLQLPSPLGRSGLRNASQERPSAARPACSCGGPPRSAGSPALAQPRASPLGSAPTPTASCRPRRHSLYVVTDVAAQP